MSFRVLGPYVLASGTLSNEGVDYLRCVVRDSSRAKLKKHPEIWNAGAGCYVFAIRKAGGAGIPWYVGITLKEDENALVKEALTVDKLRKYAAALAEAESGTPLLYFLLPGNLKEDHIGGVEQFLIWLARQRNPSLINKRKVKLSPELLLKKHLTKHRIRGMLNSPKGNPIGAPEFKKMIGWKHAMHVVAM